MIIHREKIDLSIFILGILIVGLIFAITIQTFPSFAEGPEAQTTQETPEKFITIHDNATQKLEPTTLKTNAPTVSEVLARAHITLDASDIVEPAPEEPITSDNFRINIYRARPALVIDGIHQHKIMTAATDPTEVAKNAGIKLLEADVVKITKTTNFLESGLPLAYQIIRAKPIILNFYGTKLFVRTGANTLQEFLDIQNIILTEEDWLSHPLNTPIKDDLKISLFRQGKNTVSEEEQIPFTEKITHDYSRDIGYRAITQKGKSGQKTITYEVEMKDGKEISRHIISEIITKSPVSQQITLGARPIHMQPLTPQMGRNRYTTEDGILREETFYDLDMSIVMKNYCEKTGFYTVREDGAKVDKDGYVIIAANLHIYPRCSIVVTSLGMGKVYDTGAFAVGKPEQFDIATDWTRRNGI